MKDADATSRFSDALIDDGVNDGLVALCDYSGQVKQHIWTSVADDTSEFELPPDHIRFLDPPPLRRGVSTLVTYTWSDSPYLGTVEFEPGDYHYGADETDAPIGVQVIGNTLIVTDGVDTDETLTITHEALWPVVTADSDKLDLPYWAERALGFYVVYYCLQSQGADFAVLGNWKTQRDAGRSTDNPGLEGAGWFLKQFEAICERHIRHNE